MRLHPRLLGLLGRGRGALLYGRGTLLLDARGLADQIPQVVEASSAHRATTHHIHLVHSRRSVCEGSLDADAVADPPNGERSIGLQRLVLTNDHAFEVLQPLTAALDDLD